MELGFGIGNVCCIQMMAVLKQVISALSGRESALNGPEICFYSQVSSWAAWGSGKLSVLRVFS